MNRARDAFEAMRPQRHSPPWRLHYYKDEYGNFGDDLNPWLWSRLLPGMLVPNAPVALVGIGTLINTETLPAGPKLIVGSGCGYGTVPALSDDTDVLFVRGPRTARALGLPESKAITDPAYLVSEFTPKVPRRRHKAVYIPHHVSAYRADWRRVATAAGLTYVDPSGGWQAVVDTIRSADRVVTSAMHGAILADAFRVPWVRVQEYSHINDFKWSDWADSVDVTVRSHSLPPLTDLSHRSFFRMSTRAVRAWKRNRRLYRPSAPVVSPALSGTDDFDHCVELLLPLASGAAGSLSTDAVYVDRMAKLRDAVHRMREGSPRI
jgi:hypothetical protein